MRRYWRDEDSGDLYDRERREWVPVVTEERHRNAEGDTVQVNRGRRDEREINRDDIEERR